MANEIITTDTIIDYLKKAIEEKQTISPDIFIDGAQKINVLLSDEHDKLFSLQQEVAKLKLDYLNEDPKKNVSQAKLKIEATDIYRDMQIQKAKIGRVEEFIRISKLQSRLRMEEYKGY